MTRLKSSFNEFVTWSDVIALIGNEIRKMAVTVVMESIENTLRSGIAALIHMRYMSGKERNKAQLLSWAEWAPIDVV